MTLIIENAIAKPIAKKIKGAKSSKSCPEYERLDDTIPSGNWIKVNINKARRREWCHFTGGAANTRAIPQPPATT
jgi:hypothetical protein